MTADKLLAYHNDPKLKKSVLSQMAAHRKADELVQGHGYWNDGKGCAVGCLIKSGDHSKYETQFGIPRELAYLEDRIFENLPVKDAKKWPERFLKAINTGATLTMVVSQLMLWLMQDPEGCRQHANAATIVIIDKVATLYELRIKGLEPSRSEWLSISREASSNRYADADAAYAAYAAADAAAYAAYAYAYAYAAYAAADAADAAYAYAYAAYAAAAAADAAYAAADAAARRAARQAFFVRIADKLVELLGAA